MPDLTITQEEVEQYAEPEQVFRETRKLGVGGSDVHNLFPVLNLEDKDEQGSRYGCPRKLSYEKLSIKPDYEHTPQAKILFERGHIMEDYAAQRLSEKMGVKVYRANQPRISKLHPFMRCNVDRFASVDHIRVPVECKSANEHVVVQMEQTGLPIAYSLQLQHTISVTEADHGIFAVIEVPDYVDALIEQIERPKLRSEILNALFKQLGFYSFEEKRNDDLIGIIIEKESYFWNGLILQKKLADPLPNLNDARCKDCQFRKTCRGTAWAEANDKIPVRKGGVQYTPIEEPQFVQIVLDRLQAMQNLDQAEEVLKAVDNEIKQHWPAEVTAVSAPGNVKIIWNYQRGASRWDSDALAADSKTLARKVAFADFAAEQSPELVTQFSQQAASDYDLADKYKVQSAPSRPFKFTCKGFK